MEYLFIINDSPYGSQRAYNGLRLAVALSMEQPVRVFLLGDGVTCGLAGFAPKNAEYAPQDMLKAIGELNHPIIACGTCMDARGLTQDSLIPEIRRGTLDQLVKWTQEASKVLSF